MNYGLRVLMRNNLITSKEALELYDEESETHFNNYIVLTEEAIQEKLRTYFDDVIQPELESIIYDNSKLSQYNIGDATDWGYVFDTYINNNDIAELLTEILGNVRFLFNDSDSFIFEIK